jgi:hypothetical protein
VEIPTLKSPTPDTSTLQVMDRIVEVPIEKVIIKEVPVEVDKVVERLVTKEVPKEVFVDRIVINEVPPPPLPP